MSAGLPYSVLLQLEFLECPASLQLPYSPCCSLHTFPLVYTSWTPLSGAAASSVTALGGFLEIPIASSRVSVFLICAPEGSKGVHMFFRHPGTKSIHGWSRENPNCGILAVGEVVEAHRAALAHLGKVVRVPGRNCAISICSACALSTRSARLAYPPTHTHTYTSHTRPLSIPYPSRLSKFHRGALDWGPSSITVRPTRGGGVCIYPTHTILSSFPFGIFQFAWPPQLDLSAGPDSQRLSSSCTFFCSFSCSGAWADQTTCNQLVLDLPLHAYIEIFFSLHDSFCNSHLHMGDTDGHVGTIACTIHCVFCTCRLPQKYNSLLTITQKTRPIVTFYATKC